MDLRKSLSSKSLVALKAIANGYSYDQILAMNRSMTYRDIFNAATEALTILEPDHYMRGNTHARYARFGEKWEQDEDRQLRSMYTRGEPISRIAELLKRSSGGVSMRLERLGLYQPPSAILEGNQDSADVAKSAPPAQHDGTPHPDETALPDEADMPF